MKPIVVGLGLLVTACAPAPRLAPVDAPSTTSTPPSAEPEAWATSWDWLWAGGDSMLAFKDDDRYFALVGPIRMDFQQDPAEVAFQLPVYALRTATRFATGWYFMTASGELYRSETLTGDLARVRGPSGWCGFEGPESGPAQCLDGEGRLWKAGADPLQLAVVAEQVFDAHAIDAATYLVGVDGRVRRLEGDTVVDVKTPDLCFVAIDDVDGVPLLLAATDQWWSKVKDGRWRKSPPPWEIQSSGPPFDQGYAEARYFEGMKVVAARTLYSLVHEPDADSDACFPDEVKVGHVTLCTPRFRSEPWQVHVRTDEGLEPQGVTVDRSDDFELVTHEDSFVVIGSCQPMEDAGAGPSEDEPWNWVSLCWWDRGTPRALSIDVTGWERYGTDEDADEYEEPRDAGPPVRLESLWRRWLLVTERGAPRLYLLGEALEAQPLWEATIPGTMLWGPHLVDGEIVALFERDGGVELVRRTLNGPTRHLPLPAGARHVGRATSSHWMASGQDLSQVWVSTDGGESWTALSLELDGDLSLVPLTPHPSIPVPGPWCTSEWCRLGPLLWTRASSLEGYRPPTLLAPLAPVPPPASRTSGCATAPH